jgi:PAS domain S-box-containing protein
MVEETDDDQPLRQGMFREIYHSVSDAIFVQDAETGEILDVNDTMCEMYGYTRSEARELSIEDLSSGIPPYTEEEARQYWEKATDGEPQVLDWQAKNSDGQLFWVEVSMRRAFVGDEMRILVLVRDITERKRFEHQLKREIDRLDQFASIVSHDLRNPLNVASGRIRGAMERYDDEDLESAKRSLRRMRRIIEDTLELARSGQVIDEPVAMDLSVQAEQAWQNVETDEATLSVAGPETVVADPDRVQQLFENLYRNAVEHGSTGPRSPSTRGDAIEHSEEPLTVSVGTIEGGFYVEDDGPGIPEDEREAVFDLGHSPTGDSGFGLAIVEQIAHAHGWTVTVTESAAGGARFEFRFTEADRATDGGIQSPEEPMEDP